MTLPLTSDDAETVGRKVVGMIDRLIEAECFVGCNEEIGAVVSWHFSLDDRRYRVTLERAQR